MPQTREHLAILDLLQIKGGVVALTKSDLVDADWIEMVSTDIRAELADTILANAKIIPVSSKTRAGIKDLLNELDRLLAVVAPRNDLGKPRLPIDRVFSIAGFGTVVTGTLSDGSFRVGDEIEIVPGGKRGRIRGLQTHKEKVERAIPGTRVAINLSGLAVEDLTRGQVVALPGTITASTLIDARLNYLASAPKVLEHNAEVDFFTGAAEVPARVRLLHHEVLKPGDTGWVQLQLAQPVALAKNDRFIIRFPSPSITIGGGVIVDANATTRHRRFKADVIQRLETLARGTPDEIVLQFLAARGTNPAEPKEIANATGVSIDAVNQALAQAGSVVQLGAAYISKPNWDALADKIARTLDDFHKQYPLRPGLPREELKSRLGLAPRVFERVIERAQAENILVASDAGRIVRRPAFVVTFSPELQKKIDALLAQFDKSPYTPPSAQEAEAAIGADAVNALVTQDKLVRVNESVLLTPKAFNAMKEWVVARIQANGQTTAAEVRDQFNTSRKYAVGLLEYLDELHITKRVGDARVLR
jgi:selenocysteine-specific elongation factor